MKLRSVRDLDISAVTATRYDVAVFASGYEQRCVFVSESLKDLDVVQPIVLGFDVLSLVPSRLENDSYLRARWGVEPHPVSADEEGHLYDVLNEITPRSRKTVRVLVDYSSMSRLWYAGVLNWARFAQDHDWIVIDFLYAPGEYRSRPESAVIREIVSIPGCEGAPTALSESVAVFGLGFDAFASLCVYDRLEPDVTFAFLADPGSQPSYAETVYRRNQEMAELHARALLRLPLGSVEQAYRYLAEIVQAYRKRADVTFVPMGPKPHVLACILLAHRFREVACLRVSKEERPVDVLPTGEIIGSRVELKAEQVLIGAPPSEAEPELVAQAG